MKKKTENWLHKWKFYFCLDLRLGTAVDSIQNVIQVERSTTVYRKAGRQIRCLQLLYTKHLE